MEEKTFYFTGHDAGNTFCSRFDSEDKAIKEAERLAILDPGKKVYVFKAIWVTVSSNCTTQKL